MEEIGSWEGGGEVGRVVGGEEGVGRYNRD